ncbi:MAG: exodeoxyribonuclease VII large subunit [Bacteroidota bacterium]
MNFTPLIFSVSELTRLIKKNLEELFPIIQVEGEVSNCTYHTSGHLYFTLKDSSAIISVVMWRSKVALQSFKIKNGMKVILQGSITVYEPRGNYQLDCNKIIPKGIGELQLRYEELKNKLLAEGLFDNERKKSLPEFPEKIGIVTSPTGAAIRDMINILSRRMPSVEIIIFPVKVQGDEAKNEIAEAIKILNEQNIVDLIIVGRGGGSLEDLWAFNEEIVARAISNSKIPIVSAVGHEIDFTIADFVSDLRAPTPSAAAELVVKDKSELIETINNLLYNCKNRLENLIDSEFKSISGFINSYAFNIPKQLIKNYSQQNDDLVHRLDKSMNYLMTNKKNQLTNFDGKLVALKPENILRRGFSIVRKNNKIISDANDLSLKDKIEITFKKGKSTAEISQK